MTVVDCEGAKSWRSSEAGVIAAFDSSAGKTLPYVLIAPKMYFGGRKASDIENLNVNAAAVVPHKQLPEVIAGLRKLHDQWTVELPKSIGEFWEFVSIPESDSMPVSDSVLHYRPSLRMAFNRTVGGPNLTVFIAEKDLAFIWIIDEREDLACLVDRLEKAAVLLR